MIHIPDSTFKPRNNPDKLFISKRQLDSRRICSRRELKYKEKGLVETYLDDLPREFTLLLILDSGCENKRGKKYEKNKKDIEHFDVFNHGSYFFYNGSFFECDCR
jgi:hypothetical protein